MHKDQRIIGGACRAGHEAIRGSALGPQHGHLFDKQCSRRVESRIGDLLADVQDELVSSVVSGLGAGTVCSKLLDDCAASRATLLLGGSYREDLTYRELDMLQIGYSDTWSLHKDIDGSVYWFNKQQMKSVKEPPPGWVQESNGEWKHADSKGADSGAIKDEV